MEKYFSHFERVATSLRWPKEIWTVLVQCVLVGRAQDVYASLSAEQSTSYDEVKTAILRAYELVPEAYRQRFRNYKKFDKHSYIEFAREKEHLFNRWCTSQKVDSMPLLRELVLLEEFKNCVPAVIETYLNEQKVTTLAQATVLADEYALTHRSMSSSRPDDRFNKSRFFSQGKSKPVGAEANPVSSQTSPSPSTVEKADFVCYRCKKPGHKNFECPERKWGKSKPGMTAQSLNNSHCDSWAGNVCSPKQCLFSVLLWVLCHYQVQGGGGGCNGPRPHAVC